MATIIKGLLAQNLPWAPGARRRVPRVHGAAGRRARALLGGRRLPAALDDGADLDRRHDEGASSTTGVARRRESGEESELSSGMLYATGLVAGGSLGGVLIAFVAFFGDSCPPHGKADAAREARSRATSCSPTSRTAGPRRHPLRDRLRGALLPAPQERPKEADLGGDRLELLPHLDERLDRAVEVRALVGGGDLARRRAWPCGTTGKPNPDT